MCNAMPLGELCCLACGSPVHMHVWRRSFPQNCSMGASRCAAPYKHEVKIDSNSPLEACTAETFAQSPFESCGRINNKQGIMSTVTRNASALAQCSADGLESCVHHSSHVCITKPRLLTSAVRWWFEALLQSWIAGNF